MVVINLKKPTLSLNTANLPPVYRQSYQLPLVCQHYLLQPCVSLVLEDSCDWALKINTSQKKPTLLPAFLQ